MNKTVKELQTETFDFGLNEYPIYSETYRPVLNARILNHYRYYEIGSADPEEFRHNINTTLDEIMPFYNRMYESAALTIDPLVTFSRTETTIAQKDGTKIAATTGTATIDHETTGGGTETTTGSANSTVTDIGNATATASATGGRTTGTEETSTTERAENAATRDYNKTVGSDTPAGLLAMDDIESAVYASSAQIADLRRTNTLSSDTEENRDRNETESTTQNTTTETDTTGTTTGSQTSGQTMTNTTTVNEIATNGTTINVDETVGETIDSTTTITGHDVSLSDLIIKYRETFVNIDAKIIKAVSDCFMLCFD